MFSLYPCDQSEKKIIQVKDNDNPDNLGLRPPMDLSGGDHQSPMMNLVPIVIEQTGRGERSYDIYSRLLKVNISLI